MTSPYFSEDAFLKYGMSLVLATFAFILFNERLLDEGVRIIRVVETFFNMVLKTFMRIA